MSTSALPKEQAHRAGEFVSNRHYVLRLRCPGERAHPEFAYRDANGRLLAGPCDTAGCRYMSLPGGWHHEGACS